MTQPGPGRGKGVVVRHSRRCVVKRQVLDPRCTCTPRFDAWVYEGDRKRWQSFPTFAEALEWRRLELALREAPPLVLINRAKAAKREYEAAVQRIRDRVETKPQPGSGATS